jgi:hypothetical protein
MKIQFNPGIQNPPDPLIKSQTQSEQEQNINEKIQIFQRPPALLCDNGRRMFCLGLGTEQAQSRNQDGIAPRLAGGICRY